MIQAAVQVTEAGVAAEAEVRVGAGARGTIDLHNK